MVKQLEKKPIYKPKKMSYYNIIIRLPKLIKDQYRIIYRNYAYIIQKKGLFKWNDEGFDYVVEDDIINGFAIKRIHHYEFKTLPAAKEFLSLYKEAEPVIHHGKIIKYAATKIKTKLKLIYYLPKYYYFNGDLDSFVFYAKFNTVELAKKEIDSIKSKANTNYKNNNVVYQDPND